MNLWTRSIEIIRDNQWPGGAYIACPNFPVYRYSWLRDGSFIAYAMDVAGQKDSSRRFHEWVAGVLTRYRPKVDRLLAGSEAGFLPARFNMDGTEDDSGWPNYQLDGYGTWLWALAEHVRQGGRFDEKAVLGAVEVAADYIRVMWKKPSFDCWEENGDGVHPATLACLAGGLRAGAFAFGRSEWGDAAEEIAAYVRATGILDGHLCKTVGLDEVDASLLWASVPFALFAVDDPVMLQTVRLIEERLTWPGAGVRRYPQDTYYGGGEWIILTAWLGWYYLRAGKLQRARELLSWVEKQADANGFLPEQVPANLNAPEYRDVWIARWGPVAVPLLWSHAMYLILKQELG